MAFSGLPSFFFVSWSWDREGDWVAVFWEKSSAETLKKEEPSDEGVEGVEVGCEGEGIGGDRGEVSWFRSGVRGCLDG